jgi:excisionase family DNA binding protein
VSIHRAPTADLGSFFAPDVLVAFERMVDERVSARLDMVTVDDRPVWLTLKEAAARLGCSEDAARMRANRGRLVSKHIGRNLYISRESVDGTA